MRKANEGDGKMGLNATDQPLVSVITPTYNSGQFISATIESVISQTYPCWEMVIADDCSNDGTVSIINSYMEKDSRIKLIQLPHNKGAAAARNASLRMANGKYVAFLDSDDQWLPEKLELQLNFMKEKDAAFSFTRYYLVNEAGENEGLGEEIPETTTYSQLIKSNVIGCLTVMLDTEKTGEVSMVNIRTRQDYVLWLELCKRGFTAFGIQEPLARYRIKEESISSNKIAMAKQNWKVYREIEKLNIIKSSWYFFNYVLIKSMKYLRRS